ncbi:hypothetical protein HD554DRAFT_2205647 [Boletus coccyginus]|nr:hypothetical protein HD554DRAFT_2205647 [Boletus coccyginus]
MHLHLIYYKMLPPRCTSTSLSSAIVAIPGTAFTCNFLTFLPSYWKAFLIPPAHIPYMPISELAVNHICKLLTSLCFDPVIASIINGIFVDHMLKDICYLINKDSASGIKSHHLFADGSCFELTGTSCELKPFLEGFPSNVYCTYAGTIDLQSTILISGHYDSCGSFGSSHMSTICTAPGCNDNGSGTVSLLTIVHQIKELGIKFHTNIEVVPFASKEQELLGSKAYAHTSSISAMLAICRLSDMLTYHAPNEPPQLGLPTHISTSKAAELVVKIVAIYSPELVIGYTAVCCSDHQSFHEQDFVAMHVFEHAGPIVDPMYHKSGVYPSRNDFCAL